MGNSTSTVAIVTGASRGIGAAIATRLCEQGLEVALCDLDLDRCRERAEDLATAGHKTLAVRVDVTDETAVGEMVSRVADELGPPTVLVNNAGVISMAPLTDLALGEWERILAVNLTGQFLCARAALPHMVEAGWGRIVNIASDAGKTAEPYLAHYSASKFGVIGLTQSIALEFAASGVTANAICPAITDTDMMGALADDFAAANPGTSAPAWRDAFIAELPIGRAIRPAEIADACAFLVGDAAAAINGEAINVSGGHEMH